MANTITSEWIITTSLQDHQQGLSSQCPSLYISLLCVYRWHTGCKGTPHINSSRYIVDIPNSMHDQQRQTERLDMTHSCMHEAWNTLVRTPFSQQRTCDCSYHQCEERRQNQSLDHKNERHGFQASSKKKVYNVEGFVISATSPKVMKLLQHDTRYEIYVSDAVMLL